MELRTAPVNPQQEIPTTGIAGFCARATSGHAAALPSPAMNSRRRIRHASQPTADSLSRLRFHGNRPNRRTERWRVRRPEDAGSRGRRPEMRLRRSGLSKHWTARIAHP